VAEVKNENATGRVPAGDAGGSCMGGPLGLNAYRRSVPPRPSTRYSRCLTFSHLSVRPPT
jgi:hypothetical protein